MDHNIIQDFFRRQDQPPVKVQIAFAAAAPPPRFLLADRDPPVGYAHDPGVIGSLVCEDVSCDGNISGAVLVRQWRLLRGRMFFSLFFETRELSYDPVFLLPDKGFDKAVGTAFRRADNDPAVRRYLEGCGPARTVYDLVSKRMVHGCTSRNVDCKHDGKSKQAAFPKNKDSSEQSQYREPGPRQKQRADSSRVY